MGTERQRCDCELDLDEARTGDLPPVCAWCGEMGNQYPEGVLHCRGMRVVLRLPFCDQHKNHWRRRFWMYFTCFYSFLFVPAGLFSGYLGISMWTGADSLVVDALFFAGIGAVLLGFAATPIMGIFYLNLKSWGIRISALYEDSITLMHLAPQFVEAYRVYNREQAPPDAQNEPPAVSC